MAFQDEEVGKLSSGGFKSYWCQNCQPVATIRSQGILRVRRQALFPQVKTSQNYASELLWGEEIENGEEQKGEVKRRADDSGLLAATPRGLPIVKSCVPTHLLGTHTIYLP